jgi:hypothetical protein
MSATTRNHLAIWAACILAFATTALRADQLQMQNGDHYSGKILSMSSNSIVLESDVLGKITLPRNKVLSLTMGVNTETNAPIVANFTAPIARSTNSTATISATNADVTTALRRMGANTNFIQQVRQQMLTGANPAANAKYDELVSGLMSGKLNANDIRNQAKTSIQQIQQLKRELGPEADESLDSYLSILEAFVNETAPPAVPTQTAPASFGTNRPAISADK